MRFVGEFFDSQLEYPPNFPLPETVNVQTKNIGRKMFLFTHVYILTRSCVRRVALAEPCLVDGAVLPYNRLPDAPRH